MGDDVGLTIEGTAITAGAAIEAGVAAAVIETIRGGKGHREELRMGWTKEGGAHLRGTAIHIGLLQNTATRRKRKASEYREIRLVFCRSYTHFASCASGFLLDIPHQRCPDQKGSPIKLMQRQLSHWRRCRIWNWIFLRHRPRSRKLSQLAAPNGRRS